MYSKRVDGRSGMLNDGQTDGRSGMRNKGRTDVQADARDTLDTHNVMRSDMPADTQHKRTHMRSDARINMPLFDRPDAMIEQVIDHIEKVIVGKREAIELVIVAILAGGHVLLEDVPGVGKTMLVKAIARTVDCTYRRIQFTPDLLPADLTGVSVFNPKTAEFEFRTGPLAANMILADELNRASPRTQAAMLEAMEERSITVEGRTRALPSPFLVLATQNPLEYEGTYSLPEAQLDRFLIKLSLGYPQREDEVSMLGRPSSRHNADKLKPVLLQEELVQLQSLASAIHVDDSIKRYIVDLSCLTREHPDVRIGASPRASLALMRAAQAKALVSGRSYCIPDDVKTIAPYVYAHRLLFAQTARLTGADGVELIRGLLKALPIPALRSAMAN